jgi:D-lactate dehydrogenase
LTKRLRNENHSAFANRVALFVARNFRTAEALARFGLKAGVSINSVFGKNAMINVTLLLKKIAPSVPLWSNELMFPPDLRVLKNAAPRQSNGKVKVVYFPACISRAMGTYPGKEKNILEAFKSICRKAAIEVSVISDVSGSCCGQIFSSKGFKKAHQYTANKIFRQLWRSSEEGRHPIVIDVSSCAYTLHKMRPVLDEDDKSRFDRLTILDSVEFLHDLVMPSAKVATRKGDIVLHPVCSLEKMKTGEKFLRLARHFANSVTIPKHSGCCGMAGDRGFLFPELTASATSHEASEVKQQTYDGYYSSTRTCEIAMSEAVQKNYESILYLVDEALS